MRHLHNTDKIHCSTLMRRTAKHNAYNFFSRMHYQSTSKPLFKIKIFTTNNVTTNDHLILIIAVTCVEAKQITCCFDIASEKV